MMQWHLGRKLPPLSQRDRAVELKNLAAVEMAVLIEVVMD